MDHALRRDELGAIVARLIAVGGLEAATIREVAKSSGYSKGVIEHYFDNKDALISAALDWTNQCYERRSITLTSGLTGLAALRKRIEATLPMDETVRDEWKVRMVFWGVAAVRETLRESQALRFERAQERYADNIRQCIAAGEIPASANAQQLARSLFTSTIGVSTLALYNTGLCDRSFLSGEIDRLLLQLTAVEG